jgi:hypothetical protein
MLPPRTLKAIQVIVSRENHYSGAVPRQKFPYNHRKSSESDAAQRRSECIERGGFPAAQRRRDSRLSLFLELMFSISVALAGKIAGKARNSPPKAGPKRSVGIAATTLIAPPNTKRTTHSDHFVFRNYFRCRETFIAMSQEARSNLRERERKRKPYWRRRVAKKLNKI